MSEVDAEVLVPGDDGETVQIHAYPWEKLHYSALVNLSACKTEELFKRLDILQPKTTDNGSWYWSNPCTLCAFLWRKVIARLKIILGRQNNFKNLGPLIETFFKSKIARRYGLAEGCEAHEAAESLRAFRNNVSHCNIDRTGIGGPIDFGAGSGRKEKEKREMEESRQKILKDYRMIIEDLVPLLILLPTKKTMDEMNELIKSRDLVDVAKAEDAELRNMCKSLTKDNERLVRGYRRIQADYAAQSQFFLKFQKLLSTSDEYKQQVECIKDEEGDVTVQLFNFHRSKDLTKLFIEAYDSNVSQAGHVAATESGKQSDLTGKSHLVSQLAKVIKEQDEDTMKRLRDTMNAISKKV